MAAPFPSKSRHPNSIRTVFFDKILVFGFLQPQFPNRGTVSGNQTGNLENTLVYILVQNPRKIDKILPVSAVTPPSSGWIQHSVPHCKLL